MALGWQNSGPTQGICPEGTTVRHYSNCTEECFGSPVVKDGAHHFTYLLTSLTSKGGIHVGIVDHANRRNTFSFNPYSGKFYRRGRESSQICDKLQNITGATVDVFVDMAACKLSFSINGAPHVDVPVDLPATVCPFGSLTHAGDALALSYRPHVMLVLDVQNTIRENTGSMLLRFTTKGGNEVASLVAEQEPDSAELMWDSVVDQIDLPKCDIKLVLPTGTSYSTKCGAEDATHARGCRRQYRL